jgi:integrase
MIKKKKAKVAYLDRGKKWPMFILKYADGSRQKFVKHVTWDVAEKMLREMNNRIELGTFNMADYTAIRLRSEHIGTAFIEYIDERERSAQLGLLAKATLDKDEYTIFLFIEFIGKNTLLSKISKKEIDDFVYWLKMEKLTQYGKHYTDSSILSYLKSLSVFLTWCFEKEWVVENVVKDYFKKSAKLKIDDVPKFATMEQIEQMRKELAKGGEWMLDAFNFALWTNARASEVLSVKKKDVFVIKKSDETRIVIRIEGKGKKIRVVPVGPQCAALVEKRLRWLDSGEGLRAAQSRTPIPQNAEIYKRRYEQGFLFHDLAHRSSLSAAVRTARCKAGIDRKITFHSTRHTWATDALSQGVSIAAISKTMGHARIQTTEIYAKILDDAVLHEFEKRTEI